MAKMSFEDFKEKHNNVKKVIATLSSLTKDRAFDFLTSKEIKSIFLLKKLLKSKNIDESLLSIGDEFEVEVSKGEKGDKVDKIISYKAISKTESSEELNISPSIDNLEGSLNFYSFLHKRNRFWEKTERVNNEDDKERKKYTIKKINVERTKTVRAGNKDKLEDISISEVFDDELKGWQESDFYSKLVTRHEQNAKQITDNQLATGKTLQFKPDWRLAIGLGGGSVFETSITLHHIYGFPYLPASAVKGVFRSYLISLIWGNNPGSEAIAFRDSKLMCDIFGCGEETQYIDAEEKKQKMNTFYKKVYDEDYQQFKNDKSKYRYGITEKMGDLIFFDAYPCESPQGKIKVDIMNPHYPDYYGNKNLPPADWQSPVPIIFLTVEDLTFQFMIGLRKGITNFDMSLGEVPSFKGKILDLLPTLLRMALTDKGIGAKTAVGYGYMQ